MFKRILKVLFIFAATVLIPGAIPRIYAEDGWTIRTGLNISPGLVYNRTWDPGFNGAAVSLAAAHQSGKSILEAGIEAGYSYTGLDLLASFSGGFVVAGGDKIQLLAAASLMPGFIMGRPSSYFLMAGELSARLCWAVNPDFSLSLSAGPRYTVSPAYSASVSALELIDLSLGLSAGYSVKE